MGEYKFRVWDKEEKHFWYFTLQEILERKFSYEGSWDRKILVGEKNQYTGFKDKNGKEIYENDIVISDWGYAHKKNMIVDMESIFYAYGECVLSDNIEVVGNIYESLELLESIS